MRWLTLIFLVIIGVMMNSVAYVESAATTNTTTLKPTSTNTVKTTSTTASKTTSTTTVKPTTTTTTTVKPTTTTTTKQASTTTTVKPTTTTAKPVSTTTSKLTSSSSIMAVYTTIPTLPATNSTKRGLCWPWNNNASSFTFFSPSAIPWLYNWELWDPRPKGIYSTAEYVPMCRTQTNAPQVPAYFSSCYATHLLGFNEPDLPEGNYITPYNASVLWKKYIQPVKTSCKTALGAPAVTNGVGSGWGTDWLQQFFGNCTSPSCSFDFIPLHWYGTSVSDFETYVTKFHTLFPTYPLWITEWQFTGITSAATANLEKQALQWLDAQSYVVRYAMFGPMNAANMNGIRNGAMLTDDLSGLTNVGKIYAGLM